MKIKKFYSEKNEITDVSGDYLQIEMSTDNFIMIKNLLKTGSWVSTNFKTRAKAIVEAIDKAQKEEEIEWY